MQNLNLLYCSANSYIKRHKWKSNREDRFLPDIASDPNGALLPLPLRIRSGGGEPSFMQ